MATKRDLLSHAPVLGLPDRSRARGRDRMERDTPSGEADLEHALADGRAALDELAEGVGRHRVRDASPLDEGKDGMDPSHLDIGGVEADSRQHRHHRRLEREALRRWNTGGRVRAGVDSGVEEALGSGVDLCDR